MSHSVFLDSRYPWLVFTQLAKSPGMVIHPPQVLQVNSATLSISSEISNREWSQEEQMHISS